VAACTFTHGGEPGGGDPGSGPDAASQTQRRPCDVADPSVQLCLDFEAPGQALGFDSSAGQHDATVANAIQMPRLLQQAIMLDGTSSVHVAETPALDITGSITFEAWIDPSGGVANDTGVLDNTGQYGIWQLSDGHVGCSVAGHYADSAHNLAIGAWTHVGCTYDGAQITIYINGNISACYGTNNAISTAGISGTAIGSGFVGGVDNIHVLSRAVVATEMCDHAGQTGCGGSCSTGD
jgi:hypothetical protein